MYVLTTVIVLLNIVKKKLMRNISRKMADGSTFGKLHF